MKYKEEFEKYKTRFGNYIINGKHVYYLNNCQTCGGLCLTRNKEGGYCDKECFWVKMKKEHKGPHSDKKHSNESINKIKISASSRRHSEETKKKMSESAKYKPKSEEHRKNLSKSKIGRKKKPLSKEHKRKISEALSGEKSCNWKGGVGEKDIPLYDTYGYQLEKYEEIRCSEEGYLEVRCTYCGNWYQPKTTGIRGRIRALNFLGNGECRLYCSESCKKQCPIYHRKTEGLMRDDAIRADRIHQDKLTREVQPDLRWLVLERDNYECQICGCKYNLHCHHFEGMWINPLMSADIDMCITLCKHCHLKVHKQSGCTYYDLRRKMC